MLNYRIVINRKTKKPAIETSLCGKPLLTTPQLNKGTAFSKSERLEFGLLGKLPSRVETLQQQTTRAYQQFLDFTTQIDRNIYLRRLLDLNEVLFYNLLGEHLQEMLPTLYTPIVGNVVRQFSRGFRQTRGLYIGYPDRHYIKEILRNRSNPEIDLIVVTDGERVLGIGDQGVGAIDIPVAKLIVYTACGGINPRRTLPIFLDVGTNNQTLLDDPLYLGWRHKRISGKTYDNFIHTFVVTVKKLFPNVFLHWEDFARHNANKILQRYRQEICSFNDDEQGTGAVTMAAIIAGSRVQGLPLNEQQVVIFGGGTAGMGIAQQICQALIMQGLTPAAAKQHLWIIDRNGLISDDMADLTPAQREFAHTKTELASWKNQQKHPGLLEVIHQVKPNVLIGCSSVANAFTKEIIQALASYIKRPMIFPLSNPTEYCEATPADLYQWTDGRALVATGSPFPDQPINGKLLRIAQCNNALVFPGIGLGVLAAKARSVTDGMLWQAAMTLAECAPVLHDPTQPLLPSVADSRKTTRKIALAVAKQARKEKVAAVPATTDLLKRVHELMWQPCYLPLYKK